MQKRGLQGIENAELEGRNFVGIKHSLFFGWNPGRVEKYKIILCRPIIGQSFTNRLMTALVIGNVQQGGIEFGTLYGLLVGV